MQTRKMSFPRMVIIVLIILIITFCAIPTLGLFIYLIVTTVQGEHPNDFVYYAVLGIGSSPILIGLFAIVLFTMEIASYFPELIITDTGIEYRSVFNRGFVRWEEVASVAKTKGLIRLNVIVIKREGAWLLKPKGLFFNFLQGIQLGLNQSVIPLLENAEEIENIVRGKKG
jgi:hypothetical protein